MESAVNRDRSRRLFLERQPPAGACPQGDGPVCRKTTKRREFSATGSPTTGGNDIHVQARGESPCGQGTGTEEPPPHRAAVCGGPRRPPHGHRQRPGPDGRNVPGPRAGGAAACRGTDDGLFDVVAVRNMPKPEFLFTVPKAYKGRHVGHRCVKIYRTSPIEAEMVPGGLRVIFAPGGGGRG